MSQGPKRTADELDNPAKRVKRLETATHEQRRLIGVFAAAADNTATLDCLLEEGALDTENAGVVLNRAVYKDNPVAVRWLLATFDLSGRAGQPKDHIAAAISAAIHGCSCAVMDVLVATFDVYAHVPHALSRCMRYVADTDPGHLEHIRACRVLKTLITSQHTPTPDNVRQVVADAVCYPASRTEHAFDMVMDLIDKHPELYGVPSTAVVDYALEGDHFRFIGWLLRTKRATFDPAWLRSIGIGPPWADLVDVLLDNGFSLEYVLDVCNKEIGAIPRTPLPIFWTHLNERLEVRDELVRVTGEVLPPELADICGDYFTVLKVPRDE